MPYSDPKDPRKLQRVNAWSKANPEKVKAAKRKYAENNKEACRQRIAAWREANKEKMDAARKAWNLLNKHKLQATVRKRQAAKSKRTPAWLSRDDHWFMEEMYDLAIRRTQALGFSWHVDHIVPLQGATVCGLHVPWNLQVIPAIENCKKGNRL
jgi:hypothetical protein